MTEWIIDYETRSRVSLKHANARVYAAHESTEVLCMAYTCDGGVTTHIWRPGDPFPFEYEWPDYAFAADNATFEWYIWELCCVPKYGWPRLSLEQLRCIQAQAAHAGLPRALGSRGECLGLGASAKDDQGHRNMLRLCRPQKVKGDAVRQVGRLFLGGEFDTSPEKHARNEEYCRQDVRAEALVSRLCPPLPKFEHEVWKATLRINDRGVPIDRRFVQNADAIVQIEHARLADRLEAVTGIEGVTPDSLPEIKEWVSDQNVYLPSMDKPTVQAALDGEWGTIPEAVQEMLRIRQLSGDAAVKKYKAILNHADGRDRCTGGHIYYKAGTGRWAACLTGDHEVLTPNGWVRIDAWRGGPIACWQPNESVAFAAAERTCREYDGELVGFEHKRISQLATPNHDMPTWSNYTGRFEKRPVTDINASHRLPVTGHLKIQNHIERDYLRVLVMVQADGHFQDAGRALRLSFTKTRKIERCRRLLRQAGIMFVERENGRRRDFQIFCRHMPLWLRMFSSKTFGPWLFDCDGGTFFDELQYWDSYKDPRNPCDSFQYCTTNKENADVVQAFAHLTGRVATHRVRRREAGSDWSDVHYLQIWGSSSNRVELRPRTNICFRPYSGDVYCARTATGFFLVRRNGKVWVTGNSGCQFQNLRRLDEKTLGDRILLADEVADSDNPDETHHHMHLRYNSGVIPTLGGMVRLAIKAPPGRQLVTADWSSIELRALHYLAGDAKTLKQVREQDDGIAEEFYKVAAASIFGKEPHEVTKDERQIGKVFCLGCFSEDTLVVTDNGIKPIVLVSTNDRLWDGVEWVKHDGLLPQGKQLTVNVGGVCVTPEHELLIGANWSPAGSVLRSPGKRCRALVTGWQSLWSLTMCSLRTGMFGRLWSNAKNVARTPISYTGRVSCKATPPAAALVDGGKRAARNRKNTTNTKTSCRIKTTEPGCSTEYPPQSNGAKTHRVASTATTAAGVYGYGPRGLKDTCPDGVGDPSAVASSWRILCRCLAGIIQILSWTGWTIARDMSRGIYDLCRGSKIWATAERSKNTKPVYDILNAGSRKRFTIWSRYGPLVVHNCGYAAGGNTFRLFAKGYGIELTEDRADELVKLYRRTFPLVKRLWGALRDAAVAVVKRGGRKQVGLIHFFKTGYTLNMQLPSGRAIKYYDATVVDGRFGPEIEHTYIKSGKRTAGKFNLTLPRLTENAVQGFCYDLLAESVVKADRADVPVVLLVHDEIVAEAPEKQAELKLSELVDIMEDTPRWAKGLPIKAEGGISERYTK